MEIKKLPFNMHENSDLGIQIFYKKGETILYEAHGHNFYEIFCVTDGSATHLCNGSSAPLTRGSLLFIRATDVHQYIDSSKDFCFYNLVFSIETAEKIFSLYDKELITDNLLNINYPPNITLSDADTDKLANKLIKDIETTDLKLRSLHNVELLTAILPLFITSNFYNQKLYPLWFQELLEIIDQDKNYTKGVKHLYNLATRSREHVSRCFKNYLNVTPTNYINDKKLQFASNLLIQTNIDIIDIGDMAGFNSHSHFYHLFKNKYDITPREYRHLNRNH